MDAQLATAIGVAVAAVPLTALAMLGERRRERREQEAAWLARFGVIDLKARQDVRRKMLRRRIG